MITLDSLTKDYGNNRAVNELSFTIEPGTVTGFLGPNGAGKSTTMRMILGLDAPTSGKSHATPVGEQVATVVPVRLMPRNSAAVDEACTSPSTVRVLAVPV